MGSPLEGYDIESAFGRGRQGACYLVRLHKLLAALERKLG
jgi:hypothetical protein